MPLIWSDPYSWNQVWLQYLIENGDEERYKCKETKKQWQYHKKEHICGSVEKVIKVIQHIIHFSIIKIKPKLIDLINILSMFFS